MWLNFLSLERQNIGNGHKLKQGRVCLFSTSENYLMTWKIKYNINPNNKDQKAKKKKKSSKVDVKSWKVIVIFVWSSV